MLDYDVRRIGSQILLGISVERAVVDMITSVVQLRDGISYLRADHNDLDGLTLGDFGIYPVTLSVESNDSAIIMVDGPFIESSRNLSAGVYFCRSELLNVLEIVVGELRECSGA